MKWEKLPRSVQKKIAPSWVKKQLAKLYLKAPPKVQYKLARYGIKKAVEKKREELEDFMRE